MRRIANRMLEWLFPALREWRIEAELEDGGEDAVSDADKASRMVSDTTSASMTS